MLTVLTLVFWRDFEKTNVRAKCAHVEPKAERTRRKILDEALARCSVDGLAGLTIGRLASELGMSKSGLFAQFGSKEQLEIAVLHHAAADFRQEVIDPAVRLTRGGARLVAMFHLWLTRLSSGRLPGGCPFLAAAFELDDASGPVRDELVLLESRFRGAIARAVSLCMDVGDLPGNVDPTQAAFEVHGLMLAYHFELRFMRSPLARERVERSFSAWMARVSGQPDSGYADLFPRFGVDPGTLL